MSGDAEAGAIIRQLQTQPMAVVQRVAICVFWYWVYRINGKIKGESDVLRIE